MSALEELETAAAVPVPEFDEFKYKTIKELHEVFTRDRESILRNTLSEELKSLSSDLLKAIGLSENQFPCYRHPQTIQNPGHRKDCDDKCKSIKAWTRGRARKYIKGRYGGAQCKLLLEEFDTRYPPSRETVKRGSNSGGKRPREDKRFYGMSLLDQLCLYTKGKIPEGHSLGKRFKRQAIAEGVTVEMLYEWEAEKARPEILAKPVDVVNQERRPALTEQAEADHQSKDICKYWVRGRHCSNVNKELTECVHKGLTFRHSLPEDYQCANCSGNHRYHKCPVPCPSGTKCKMNRNARLLEKELAKLKKESKPVPLSLQSLQRACDLHYRSKGEVFCMLQHFGKDWEAEWDEKPVAKSRAEAKAEAEAKEVWMEYLLEPTEEEKDKKFDKHLTRVGKKHKWKKSNKD